MGIFSCYNDQNLFKKIALTVNKEISSLKEVPLNQFWLLIINVNFGHKLKCNVFNKIKVQKFTKSRFLATFNVKIFLLSNCTFEPYSKILFSKSYQV